MGLAVAVTRRFAIGFVGALGGLGMLAGVASAYTVANTAANAVSFYAGLPGTVSKQAPTRKISGAATGLHAPIGLASSNTGVLYVSNRGANSITVYAASANGNAAPIRTIAGASTGLAAPEGVALDRAGRLFVANLNANSITEYAAGASGNVAPIARIVGAATGLAKPRGIALDGTGRLFVVNNTADSVTEYAPAATGNVVPQHTIQGAATGLSEPDSIVLSSFDDLVVGNGGQTDLTEYLAGASGNAAPFRTIGPISGLITPGGLALPDGNHIVVTGTDSNSVESILPDATVVGSNSGSGTGLNQPTGLLVSVPLTLDAAEAQQPTLTVGRPYAEHALAFGGVWPYTWSVASGTLPAGLQLDTHTGAITGTPTTAGGGTVVIRVTDSAATPASATNTRTYTVNPAIQPAVYVSNGANTAINAFALTSSGNVAPWTTFGPANGLDAASGVAFDAQGHLFVANYDAGNIREYPAGVAKPPIATQSGLTTPTGITVGAQVVVTQQAANTVTGFSYDTTSGLLGGHAFDLVGPDTGLSAPDGVVFAGGMLWVADYGSDSLTAYRLGASGDAKPAARITGPATGLSNPEGLGVNTNGDLLVANQFGPSVTEYSPTASGDVAPVRTIAGASTGLSGPASVDVDTQGRLYVANGFANTVLVFAANASGNAAPVTTYGGPNTGIAGPTALAVTPPLSILTARLPRGRARHHYRVKLRAAEGTTPYRWSLRRGRLPRGLHLSRRGVISGVPKRAGRWRFTVRVRDASRRRVSVTRRLQLTIERRHRPHRSRRRRR
ncbi:MAG TPA: putative Ig domain-containing protein [Solirubrobacteraceae bacterium]|jgi:sugar lactone lactonase YvrE